VHDKQVRRRRAVLGLLVAVSIILLTAYFGESPSSPLHSVQRGIDTVLSPIQSGASTALKPFRDITGFFSDTFRAKDQVKQLKKQVQTYRTELAQLQNAQIVNSQLSKEVGLDNSIGISSYQPVAAHLLTRDSNLWYASIEVDKGSDDGVRNGDPVLGDGALVGHVTDVASGVSWVTLITDHSSAVTAEVQDAQGDTGVLVPAVGNPDQLILQEIINRKAPIQNSQQVVTAGFKSGPLDSLFPPGIPIGQVTNFTQAGLLGSGQVSVNIAADLRHLDSVQILTKPHPASSQRAQVP
jgi:rod shape-determining protein MreC